MVGKYAMDFQQQINGDVEIYLPEGADSSDLLSEVREQWSTDIVIIYIQTDNAISSISDRGNDNICLLYTSQSPRDVEESRMPSSA